VITATQGGWTHNPRGGGGEGWEEGMRRIGGKRKPMEPAYQFGVILNVLLQQGVNIILKHVTRLQTLVPKRPDNPGLGEPGELGKSLPVHWILLKSGLILQVIPHKTSQRLLPRGRTPDSRERRNGEENWGVARQNKKMTALRTP